jgi:hypothetical protein
MRDSIVGEAIAVVKLVGEAIAVVKLLVRISGSHRPSASVIDAHAACRRASGSFVKTLWDCGAWTSAETT